MSEIRHVWVRRVVPVWKCGADGPRHMLQTRGAESDCASGTPNTTVILCHEISFPSLRVVSGINMDKSGTMRYRRINKTHVIL